MKKTILENKQRLFEVMGRMDKTFKPKMNEEFYGDKGTSCFDDKIKIGTDQEVKENFDSTSDSVIPDNSSVGAQIPVDNNDPNVDTDTTTLDENDSILGDMEYYGKSVSDFDPISVHNNKINNRPNLDLYVVVVNGAFRILLVDGDKNIVIKELDSARNEQVLLQDFKERSGIDLGVKNRYSSGNQEDDLERDSDALDRDLERTDY